MNTNNTLASLPATPIAKSRASSAHLQTELISTTSILNTQVATAVTIRQKALDALAIFEWEYEQIYQIDLTHYQHLMVKNFCDEAICAYLSARSLVRAELPVNYAAERSFNQILKTEYTNKRGLEKFYKFRDKVPKEKFSWQVLEENDASIRTRYQQTLEAKLSEGKPCLIPIWRGGEVEDCKVATSYYIVVALYKSDKDQKNLIGIKDVMQKSPDTFYYKEQDLLDAVWDYAYRSASPGKQCFELLSLG